MHRVTLPIALAALVLLTPAAHADTTPQPLPFSQDWSNTGLITANGNWSGVPGIIGYRGDDLTTATGTDPQTILVDGSATPVDVNANQTNPNTFSTGGVAEFHLANPTIALNGSGTADAPHIVISLNTLGSSGIRVRYNLRDLDASTDNAVSPVALQYRVGASGSFTNIPAAFVADASSGPSLATQVIPVDVTLPATADNQPLVQLRIITTNAVGNDEWIGIDDIVIAAVTADQPVIPACPGSLSATAGTAASAGFSATDADDSVVNVSVSAGGVAGISVTFAPSASTGAPLAGTLTVGAGVPAGNYPITLRFENSDAPPQTATCNIAVTVGAPVVPARIHDIQGPGHRSPLEGITVSDVPGIVTARASNGFYLQDPNPDADDRTSEGIFVFTSATPTVGVGDAIRVTGVVSEFRPGGVADNLTITEIVSPTVTVDSTGNALPAPTVLGNGGRVPPASVIEDDASPSVETGGTFDPAQDGIDFYESLEGMRVQINGARVVGPTNQFGEIWVVGDNGANAGVLAPRGGVIIRPGDFNPERIQIDDDLFGPGTMPAADVGDLAQFSLVGVVGYAFGNYEVLLTTAPSFLHAGLVQETTTLAGDASRLTVASYNVENLDPGDGAAKFEALAGQIVNHLRSPDVVALMEVQDNNGPVDDGVVDAGTTLAGLTSAIVSAGGPVYHFRQINPLNDQDGGEPGGNIRVAFLFNPTRVTFVDRPGATSTTANTVLNVAGAPHLQYSPGRIDPANPAFLSSRKPLAAEFRFGGHSLFVIANHFNSKGGDQPLFGQFQPPALASEAQRTQQASVVAGFVQQIFAVDAAANVIVMGDLNDFQFSQPLGILKAAGLTTLVETLPENERYTYVFDGNSQTLDHILVSANLLSANAEYDVVHVNAEFAAQASDHDPEVARFDLPRAEITGSYSIQSSGFAYNLRTRQFNNTVNLTNASGADIAGPLRVVFDSLTPGVALANATGNTAEGWPYIELGGTAAGSKLSIPATYINPSRGPINYVIRVYPGPF